MPYEYGIHFDHFFVYPKEYCSFKIRKLHQNGFEAQDRARRHITLMTTRIIMYIPYIGWFIISLLTIVTICGLDFGTVLSFMIPKSEAVNRSRIDNAMAKKKDKEQTTIYKALHIKLKIQ